MSANEESDDDLPFEYRCQQTRIDFCNSCDGNLIRLASFEDRAYDEVNPWDMRNHFE